MNAIILLMSIMMAQQMRRDHCRKAYSEDETQVSEGKNDNEKEFRKTEHEEKTGKQNVDQLS